MTPLSLSVRWGTWLTHAVMITVCAAGALKLVDLESFEDALDSWVLVPRALRQLAVFGVPTAEVFIGMSWFFGPGRAWVLWLGVALLTLFAVVYGVHVLTVGPPKCECFGKILQYRSFQTSARWIVVRDALLCLPLLVTLSGARHRDAGKGRAVEYPPETA